MSSSSRIYVLFFVFIAILGAALLLPRLTASGTDGLAAGATAAITFLGILLLALVLAVVLLVTTLRQRAVLSGGAKVAGFLPLPLLLLGVMVVVFLIRQKNQDRRHNELLPPKTTPATTVP